jgi:hypothetical protein
LQGHRVLDRREGQQAVPVAMQHRAGCEHFGIEQAAAGERLSLNIILMAMPFT